MNETGDMTTSAQEAVERTLREILSAAMADAGLRARLREDPAGVLAEAGLPPAPGTSVVIMETNCAEAAARASTPGRLVLPLPPETNGALSDDQLDGVAGGGVLTGLLAGLGYPASVVVSVFANLHQPGEIKTTVEGLGNLVVESWNMKTLP